jgi:hypothetical protein
MRAITRRATDARIRGQPSRRPRIPRGASILFDLDPQAAVAGRIGRVGALADDAFQRHGASLFEEGATVADLMIAVPQR